MNNKKDDEMMIDNPELEAEIDRMYYESLQEGKEYTKTSKIPKVVEKYVTSAVEVSLNNEVPAMLSYYNLLGQICKDFVCIPSGRRRIDTRLQVIIMQTSGTGKTELYNFFGPIAKEVFKQLNERYPTDIPEEYNRTGTGYSVAEIKDTTDAGLIGSMGTEEQVVVDDETGRERRVEVPVQIYGELEGSGLLVYDEFADSGIFKQSQHQNKVVLYINTFMNTLWGQNWIITKRLLKGGLMECRSRRSMWATTYIPKTLTHAITETGAMQRSLIYIREVPISEQNYVRNKIADAYGVIDDAQTPIDGFAGSFVKIYDTLKKHYEETGEDPLRTITFGKGFNDAIKNETWKFQNFVQTSRPAVMEIANNFITRMQGMMVKLAVLSCIAESGTTIRNKENRFIVTERHVTQGAYITRQCYKSLVSWLDLALKADHKSIQERAKVGEFKKAFSELVKTPNARVMDGEKWVNKSILLAHVMKTTRRGQAQVYRNYKEVSEHFDERREGRYGYVKMKKEVMKR
tara:strand:- start:2049 stop:3599 length:1551 start_codon:yes stop_codon:yes gene_type:complete